MIHRHGFAGNRDHWLTLLSGAIGLFLLAAAFGFLFG